MSILRKLRENANMTQDYVAEKFDRSINTVKNWESTMKFRSPEDLHKLLNLYRVNDAVRALIVQQVYGSKSSVTDNLVNNHVVENIEIKDITLEGVVTCKINRLDRIVEAIEVLEGRIKCLTTTVDYINYAFISKCTPDIFGIKTAKIIDLTADEYDITVDAEKTYLLSEAIKDIKNIYPYGEMYDYKVYVPRYGKEMTYEECLHETHKSIGKINRSLDDNIFLALNQIEAEIYQLKCILRAALLFIAKRDDVEVSYVVDMVHKCVWDLVTVKVTGKTFKTMSSETRIKQLIDDNVAYKTVVLDNKPVDLEAQVNTVNVDVEVFYDKAVVAKALDILKDIVSLSSNVDETYMDDDEWIDFCVQSDELQNYITKFVKNYMSKCI